MVVHNKGSLLKWMITSERTNERPERSVHITEIFISFDFFSFFFFRFNTKYVNVMWCDVMCLNVSLCMFTFTKMLLSKWLQKTRRYLSCWNVWPRILPFSMYIQRMPAMLGRSYSFCVKPVFLLRRHFTCTTDTHKNTLCTICISI